MVIERRYLMRIQPAPSGQGEGIGIVLCPFPIGGKAREPFV